jgi:phosphomannomutase
MITSIKFGTDGWRAIIGKDFTVANIARVAEATAQWLLKNHKSPSVVLGHDTRFGGELFAESCAKIFCNHGIKTLLAKGFVSTPMVSLGVARRNASLGIIITASHNPPEYNGFKLKGPHGGPMMPDKTEEIENLIPSASLINLDVINLKKFEDNGLLEYVDLESMYCEHIESSFDLKAIKKSGLRIAYDAMFGAGQDVMRRLFPKAVTLHCENNPSFKGQAPEPLHKNLIEFSELIKKKGNIDFGLATDGDADRLGLYDKEGNFIDSHHVILILLKYLHQEKGMNGKVVTAFSVSPKVEKLCKHLGLEQLVTKIGFKHIVGSMINGDALLGGEESGGMAIKGHIPERDGIWTGLTILECMAKTGKSLRELVNEVYDIVGPFAFERSDLHIQEDLKNQIVANCERNAYSSFGNYKIVRTENVDGFKYFFNDDDWFMVRASGTEPVLRNYAQSSSIEEARQILKAAEETFLGSQSPHAAEA